MAKKIENNEIDDILNELDNVLKDRPVPALEKTAPVILTGSDKHFSKPFVLPGRETLNRYFNEEIVDFFKNKEAYEAMGIKNVGATLLYGPPGTGKTHAVTEFAKYLGFPVFEINSLTVGDTYVHGTPKKIAKVFEKAKAAAPSVLIIDEMETYMGKRCNDDWKAKLEETDEFLRNIPTAVDSQVVIFGMTNMLKDIDPAILRKGRFDNQIEVGPANKEEILAVLKYELTKTKAKARMDLGSYAEALKGRPLSDVSFMVRQAIRNAVHRGRQRVDEADLTAGLEKLKAAPQSAGAPHRAIGFCCA